MRDMLIQITKEAGDLVYTYFKTGKNKQIDGYNKTVTKADIESEKFIIEALEKEYPHYNILGEEGGDRKKNSEYTWVIDPLDGTSNFIDNSPFFAVSVALCKNGDPEVGVIYAPVLDELYYAEKGKGAFLNSVQIKVSIKSTLDNANFVFCEGKTNNIERVRRIYSKLRKEVKDIRKLGSAAIECAYVATGKTDAYITTDIMPWDVAAGVVLITEAGGKVTDFHGKKWQLKQMDFLASNKVIHPYIQTLLEMI